MVKYQTKNIFKSLWAIYLYKYNFDSVGSLLPLAKSWLVNTLEKGRHILQTVKYLPDKKIRSQKYLQVNAM